MAAVSPLCDDAKQPVSLDIRPAQSNDTWKKFSTSAEISDLDLVKCGNYNFVLSRFYVGFI
jgi:hypothetical protein